jgi:CheY-like chemotaxis protein
MKTILVVDDSKEIRQLVRATLETDDYKVVEAEDGTEALQMCSELKPELVIMDVKMPGTVDGIKATRIIKGSKDTAGCQVIMLSGVGGTRQVNEAIEAGAADFLKKPFSPLELIEKVEQALGVAT